MTIELTEQQQAAIDARSEIPPRFIDPRSKAAYYLIPAAEYEALRESLEEQCRQRAIRATGLRNAAGRLREVS